MEKSKQTAKKQVVKHFHGKKGKQIAKINNNDNSIGRHLNHNNSVTGKTFSWKKVNK